jgi:hypothetical protein
MTASRADLPVTHVNVTVVEAERGGLSPSQAWPHSARASRQPRGVGGGALPHRVPAGLARAAAPRPPLRAGHRARRPGHRLAAPAVDSEAAGVTVALRPPGSHTLLKIGRGAAPGPACPGECGGDSDCSDSEADSGLPMRSRGPPLGRRWRRPPGSFGGSRRCRWRRWHTTEVEQYGYDGVVDSVDLQRGPSAPADDPGPYSMAALSMDGGRVPGRLVRLRISGHFALARLIIAKGRRQKCLSMEQVRITPNKGA